MNNDRFSEFRAWRYALIGVLTGAIAMYLWNQASNEEPMPLVSELERGSDPGVPYAFKTSIGVNSEKAYTLFMNYQVDEHNPAGLLKTQVGDDSEAILGFYLDKWVIEYLEDNARGTISAPLQGYFLMIGKNNELDHKMILAGVYEDEKENLVMLLPTNATDETLIANHVLKCPPFCPDNVAEGILWKKDWLDSMY